jgi:beta-glucanase (GH16 family)
MVNFIKILFLSLLTTVYSCCIPQNIDMNIPYQNQNISVEYNSNNVVQQNGLLNLLLTNTTGGTRIKLDNKIQYGRIDVNMKVAKGNSIVSAFVLFSDETLDEVDFEFVQRYEYPNRNIQTTFYYKGIPLYNVNDLYIDTGIDLAYSFNTYTFIWDKEFYEWRFNDKFLRRTYRNETENYPDSLSYVKISIWEHEPSKWSGPAPDWKDAPYVLSISSINVTCVDDTKIENEKLNDTLQYNNSVSNTNYNINIILLCTLFNLIYFF